MVQNPRARNDYEEETAYDSYMNPEPGSQSGPGNSADAGYMAPCLLVTKSSPSSGGRGSENGAEVICDKYSAVKFIGVLKWGPILPHAVRCCGVLHCLRSDFLPLHHMLL